MRIVLDPAAVAELREAAVFYEECREGLGREFVANVEAAFDAIAPANALAAAEGPFSPLPGSPVPVRGRLRGRG